jgi:2-oxoglutarate dehydrogenase E2 component (dihydrolipoamide succinyltransferase)
MAIEMKVPSVGESVTEVTIASWVKKDGDFVKMDEVICELESDKATFELPAEGDGILKILAKEGETLAIGAPICTIETSGAAAPEAPKATEAAAAPAAEAPAPESKPAAATSVVDVTVPTVGESITEVTIASWSKKDGDAVAMDEIICELESDKATFELPSPQAGVLKIVAAEGSTIAIGGIIAKIEVGGAVAAAPSSTSAAPAQAEVATSKEGGYAAGHPSPAASKVLAEKGIEATAVSGSGVGGRITKEDALKAGKPAEKVAPAVATAPAAPATPAGPRSSRREKMSSLRKTIARPTDRPRVTAKRAGAENPVDPPDPGARQ